MLELNKPQRTKKGELLIPFAVQDGVVSCFTQGNETVSKSIDDFLIKPKKVKKIVDVIPISKEIKTPEIIEEIQPIKTPIIEPVKEPEIIIKPVIIPQIPVEESKDKVVVSPSTVGNRYLDDEDYI